MADDFYRKTLAGETDNDRGGRNPSRRRLLRSKMRQFLYLVQAVEHDGFGGKSLTEQDWVMAIELCKRLDAIVTVNLRISQQQSNSTGKRGEIAGNRR